MPICLYTYTGIVMHEIQKCDNVKQMAGVFRALGDANRLAIIGILASDEYEKVCVGDLARILEITQPAVSQHLRTLKSIGMVESSKEGNFIYYTFNRGAMFSYKESIDEMFGQALEKCKGCSGGNPK